MLPPDSPVHAHSVLCIMHLSLWTSCRISDAYLLPVTSFNSHTAASNVRVNRNCAPDQNRVGDVKSSV